MSEPKATHAAYHASLAKLSIEDARAFLPGDVEAGKLADDASAAIKKLESHIAKRREMSRDNGGPQ